MNGMIGITQEELDAATKAGPGRSSAAFAATDPRRTDYVAPKATQAALPPETMLGSAARGALQGATAGFSDEMMGAGAAVGKTALGALMVLAGSKAPQESFNDTYTRVRDAERAANDNASNSNPATYGISKVLGTILPALLTDGSSLALTGTGAAMGAGNSNADTVGGIAKDAATGAAANLVGGKLMQGVGNVAKGVLNKASNAALDSATTPGTSAAPGVIGSAWKAAKDSIDPVSIVTTGSVSPSAAVGMAAAKAAGAAATGASKAVLGKAVVNNVNAGGSGMVGNAAVNKIAQAATAIPGAVGTTDAAKSSTDSVMDFVRNSLGMNTPAGQQNITGEFRDKMANDAEQVQAGTKDGRVTPDVPNIIKENGNTYLVSPTGAKILLN